MEKEDITFSTVLIQLLSGIVVKEAAPESWNMILSQQYRINEYMEKIGLLLVIDEDGGYAFLKQKETDELPHLVKK